MATQETLFDLFGNFIARWPVRVIQEHTGIAGGTPPDPTLWLTKLNAGIKLENVRTGATADRVSIEAQLTLNNEPTGTAYLNGFPFVLASMPDVEFRVPSVGGPDKFIHLFASVSDRGMELVVERLPVEIRLPAGLIEPHPNTTGHPSGISEIEVGKFTPGKLDELKIIYKSGGPSSIFVHVRLHINEDGQCEIRTTIPVSFGQCRLSGMPCRAVHDFSLIPSPTLVPQNYDWVRHSVEPWAPSMNGPLVGLFAARSVDIDSNESPFKDASQWLNQHSEKEAAAEFVLDDTVVPFFSPWIIPIPHHITLGIRRRVIDPGDERQIFAFDRAPVQIVFRRDPAIIFIIESLFFKSLPSEQLSRDLGLSFEAGLVFADKQNQKGSDPKIDQHAILIGLGENYSLHAGYRREFSSQTGMPAPGTGAGAVINRILHWEIATIVLDIMAIRIGYSLGRAIGENMGFLDCAELTVDVFVSMPPTGGDKSFFKLRSLNGEKVAFAIEGLGWRQGSFHLEGLSMPDGVVAMFGPVKIIIQEIGLIAENGASYLSFSAGVAFPLPKGFEGAIGVRRLRFRVAGNQDAPPFKLDGFFARVKGPSVLIEAGGFFTETVVGDTRVREFGLTGTVKFEISKIEYMFGLDLLVGSRKSPSEEFDYFMFQVFFRGSVTIAWFELRGARVLFANNMQPKLQPVDKQSQNLRYYKWYKDTNPIDVPGDRRLAAWQAHKGSWALGVGVSASISGLGKLLELGLFVLVISGDDEHGFLIVGELRSGQNPTPLGYFALEWDGKNDRFSLMIGVNLTIKSFMKSAPEWSEKIAKLTGTIFISNDPGTFAIGRLDDQRTWLTLRFDIDLWVFKTFILFAFCFEYVDGPAGSKGTGLIVRIEGGLSAAIIRLTYNIGFGIIFAWFQTGSTDYSLIIWIEGGVKLELFFFLRFGITARAEFHNVGSKPSRSQLRVDFHLETPWFLPDVDWTFEVSSGTIEPEKLATSVSPLRIASATQTIDNQSFPVHMERFDMNWNGQGTAPTFSVVELRGFAPSEADRASRFEGNASLKPIATDATIGVEWSVAVNDQLKLDTSIPPGLGEQKAGDLSLTYEFAKIAVRRRSRFGSDRAWKPLEERKELKADFSDPSGVKLDGAFGPGTLTKFWDHDVRVGGKQAAKKLLINGSTPFDFTTKNPEADEETVRDNPHWPCCDERKPSFKIHEVIFRAELVGVDVNKPRLFTESQSRLTFLRPTYVRPQQFGTAIPPASLVACCTVRQAGPFFRAELDEEAAFCMIRMAWQPAAGSLKIVAYDERGMVVAETVLPLGAGSDFQNILLAGRGPVRRLEARLISIKDNDGQPSPVEFPTATLRATLFEIDRVAYVGLRSYLDILLTNSTCKGQGDDFKNAYAGKGKLFFLPNHDYEIAVTTRVTAAHPSKPAESAEVTEYVYFKTKGLPGLNAVKRVGDELQPYVNSAYAGGRGVLYREEPVVLVFKDDFSVAVPLAQRPPGTSTERNTLLKMKLLVQPDTAATLDTPFTTTGTDWIVAHRTSVVLDPRTPWLGLASVSTTIGTRMMSTNPMMHRLATLTQRADGGGGTCGLTDPRNAIGPALIAWPQGEDDPVNPGRKLWPGTSRFTAKVRQEGAAFVDRREFQTADLTAFQFALDASAVNSTGWSVVDKELRVSGSNVRRFASFGDSVWNHLTIQVGLKPGAAVAGVGVGLPAFAIPTRGLFAVVEQVNQNRRLVIYRRDSGTQWNDVGHVDIPAPPDVNAPITLIVTAFDDRLRASVGEATVEVERVELRDGILCLMAQGAAQFTSLQVTGLDMYSFPFAVSRFRSFNDHIQSFRGAINVMEPNALGAGTTTGTTSALWTATRADIQNAMQPAAEPPARQALFDRWINELGLPLKDEVNVLEISRFVVGARTELLLIESPETLDFTEEVTLKLAHRELMDGLGFETFALTDVLAERLPARSGLSETERLKAISLSQERVLENLLASEGIMRERQAQPERGHQIIKDVIKAGETLHIELDPAAFATSPVQAAGSVVFAEAVEAGGERRLYFYTGEIDLKSGGRRTVVRAEKVDEVIVGAREKSVLFPKEVAELHHGEIVALSPDLRQFIDRFSPFWKFVDVETSVLQDGTGRRALLIPLTGGATLQLSAGSYRLTFNLSRKRWQTLEAPDDTNHYQRMAVIGLTLQVE